MKTKKRVGIVCALAMFFAVMLSTGMFVWADTPDFDMSSSTSWNVLRLNESVTLKEGEGVEIGFTVSSANGLRIMPSFNEASLYADTSLGDPFVGVEVFAKSGIGASTSFMWSETLPTLFTGHQWGVAIATNSQKEAFVNQNSTVGATPDAGWQTLTGCTIGGDWSWSIPIRFRAIFRADGSMTYYMQNENDSEWMMVCYVKENIGVMADANPAGQPWEQFDHPARADQTPDYYSKDLGDFTGKACYPALAFVNAVGTHDYSISDVSLKKLGADDSVTETLYENNDGWVRYEKVTGVALNKAELSLSEGSKETLVATVSPENATDKTLTWSSSDESVVTVSASGEVTAVKAGNATITAVGADGIKVTCAVTVTPAEVAVTGITLDKTELTLTEGDKETLTATVSPENATDKTLTWSSSDESVVTVSASGEVTAVKAGNATITAVGADGIKVTCAVTVTPAEVAVTGITLDKTELTLTEGDKETLTATVSPENATDKTLTWSSSDESVVTVSASGEVTAVAAGSATVTASAANGIKGTCNITVNAVQDDTQKPEDDTQKPEEGGCGSILFGGSLLLSAGAAAVAAVLFKKRKN